MHARYGDVVTRRAWDELAELFVPDMPLELDLVDSEPRHMAGPDQIGEFLATAVSRFDFFEFTPLNAVTELYPRGNPDEATARLWIREDRHGAAGSGEPSEWTSAFGLYRDTYRRIQGRWWFATRHYRSLARTGPVSAVLPFPDLD